MSYLWVLTAKDLRENPQYAMRPFYQIIGGLDTRMGNFFTQPDMTIHEIVQPHSMESQTIKYQDAFPGSNQSPLFAKETIHISNSDHPMHIFPKRPTTQWALATILKELAPLARFQIQAISPDALLQQNPDLPLPHLTHDPSFSDKESKMLVIFQLVIEKALDKSGGLNTDQFYKDLEKTKGTNPWVFQHAKHYQQMDDAYMYLDPKIRAKEIYTHLGAVFGYNLFYTPLAAHYRGILKESESGDYNQKYLYATDPENVYKFNHPPGAYQSVNYQPPWIWPQIYPFNASPQQVQQIVKSMTPEQAKKYNFNQPFRRLGLKLDQKMPAYLRGK